MSDPKPTVQPIQRQIPRVVAAIDDMFEEGRGVVISGHAVGSGVIDITIGNETVTVDRATFVKQAAVYAK